MGALRRSVSKGWDLFEPQEETTQIYSKRWDLVISSQMWNIAFFSCAPEIHTQKHMPIYIRIISKIQTCFWASLSFYCFPNGEYFLSWKVLSFIHCRPIWEHNCLLNSGTHTWDEARSGNIRVLTWCWSTSDIEVKIAFWSAVRLVCCCCAMSCLGCFLTPKQSQEINVLNRTSHILCAISWQHRDIHIFLVYLYMKVLIVE